MALTLETSTLLAAAASWPVALLLITVKATLEIGAAALLALLQFALEEREADHEDREEGDHAEAEEGDVLVGDPAGGTDSVSGHCGRGDEEDQKRRQDGGQ